MYPLSCKLPHAKPPGFLAPASASPCRRGHKHRLPVPCSLSYDRETPQPSIPPPPPPPQTPPPQATSRRGLIQVAAFGGAGMLAGVLLGRSGQAPDVDPEARQRIDQVRADSKFRRDYEGHVFVQARDGSWFEVKLDAKIPGALLLRDQDGFVYYITSAAQQVDLTEDYIVAAIFGDGMWENGLKKVQGADDNGVLVDAVLDQEAFRDLISITE